MFNNDNIGDQMNMILPAIGLLFVVVSVELHPDSIPMELGMLLGIIGILLVYIPLYKQERRDYDSWDR